VIAVGVAHGAGTAAPCTVPVAENKAGKGKPWSLSVKSIV